MCSIFLTINCREINFFYFIQGVSGVKTEIDGMRTNRDTFMNDMGMLKGQLKDQNNRMLLAAQEKVRLEKVI